MDMSQVLQDNTHQNITQTPAAEIEEAVIAFAVAKGNAPLAAERLHIPETRLRYLIAQDLPLLAHHLKAQTLIGVFEVTARAHDNLKTSIPDMEPYEQSKTYTALLNIVTELTKPIPTSSETTQPHLVINNMMQAFPPEIQDAFRLLLTEQDQPSNVIDINADHNDN